MGKMRLSGEFPLHQMEHRRVKAMGHELTLDAINPCPMSISRTECGEIATIADISGKTDRASKNVLTTLES